MKRGHNRSSLAFTRIKRILFKQILGFFFSGNFNDQNNYYGGSGGGGGIGGGSGYLPGGGSGGGGIGGGGGGGPPGAHPGARVGYPPRPAAGQQNPQDQTQIGTRD